MIINRIVVDYCVAQDSTGNGMAKNVREKLKEGWQPLGAPIISTAGNYTQAMVKYGKDDEE